MMCFYSHTEGQNYGLLGVFVSHNKQSHLLICWCEHTQSERQENTDPGG